MIGVKTGLDITSMNKTKTDFAKLLKDLQNTANKNPIKINISNTTSQINQINNSISNMSNQANTASGNFKTLGSSMGSLTGFYMRWLSISSLVNLALMETRKAINFVIDQQEVVRNVSMITGESQPDVQKYTKGWNDLALALKQSTGVVQSSNEEWLRAGANLSEINELSKMTIKTSEIAGSNIKDTTTQAIALKNAYGLTNEALGGVLDSVVKMDNTSSTGTDKLMRSLLVTSSVAKGAKVPLDWLVASLTTVQSKSKQTAESVGKNFKNIFLNITAMTSSKDQVGLNKAEDQLNKIDIAMRSNSTTFRSADKILDDLAKKWTTLTEVQQAELGASLAKKENINSFNILMQNQAENVKNLTSVKTAQGSVDKAYEEHLNSTKGALGELQATTEHLYMTLLSGDTLKNVINDLTKIVQVVEFMLTDGRELTAVWIGLIVAIKNFTTLKYAIGECVAFMSLLRTEGLETLTLLNFNPVILAITALVAIVGIITYSQFQHSQQVKELKTSYDNLNKSMNEMDGAGIKTQTDELKKQQKTLDELAKYADVKIDLGMGVKDDGGQRNLDEFIKTLEESGYTVDKVHNKILELGVAESNIATSDSIKSIQDKTQATIDEATETQSLIGQYQMLSQQENLSADKKKLLSGLSEQLVGRMGGLTTSIDANGNMIITNVGYMSNQVDAMEVLKQQAVATGNTEISMAVNSASAIHAGTMQTLDDMKSKILSYQALNNALSNTSTGKNGFFDTIITANKMGEANLQASVDRIETLKSKFSMKAPAITASGTKGGVAYKPTASGSAKDKASAKADAKEDVENLELKVEKNYKLEGALNSVNDALDRNNKLQSNSETKVKLDLMDKELKLLDNKKKILNDLYKAEAIESNKVAKELGAKGFKFDYNTGQISNKNELLTSLTNIANKKTGDAKKKAIEDIKTIQETIEKYDDLKFTKMSDNSNKLFDLEQDRLSKTKEIYDLNLDEINNLLEFQQKSAEIELKQQQENAKNKLSSSIYGGSGTSDENIKAYDKQNQAQQDAIQNQIDALNEVNDIQEEIETRLANQNSLTEKSIALTNAQNNKNVQSLTKNEDGSFQFKYVADASAVESAQKAVDDQTKSNNDWEKTTALKHQIESLNKLKQGLADQKTAKDEAYSEQLAKLEATQNIETDLMNLHYSDMNLLADNSLKLLTKTYGDNWNAIIAQLTLDVAKAKALQDSLLLAQASGTISSTVKGTTGAGNSASITVNTEVDKALLQAKYGSGVNITVSSGDGATGTNRDATLALNEKILAGQGVVPRFASGGEVGSWSGTSSRLAMVDTKERVLSSTQTQDFSKLVQQLPRTLGSMERLQTPKLNIRDVMPDYGLPMAYMPKGLTNMSEIIDKISMSSVNNSKNGDVPAQYTFTGDLSLPNITNESGVNELIQSIRALPRLATQYGSSYHPR